MGHIFRHDGGFSSNEPAPTEAWLFAQLIRGEHIPPIVNPEARAKAKREELERLAQFSSHHAGELSRIKVAEAEARREREALEWAAQISTRAEEKLRALQQREAEERTAWRRAEAFYERHVASVTEWNPSQLRVPAGSPQGGQWSKGGGGGGAGSDSLATGGWRSPTSDDQGGPGYGGDVGAGPFQLAAYRPGGASIKLTAAAGGANAGNWPVFDPRNLAMPRIEGAAGAAAAGAAIGAVGFATALRNASMVRYWERVPATQVMPQHWAYELEKRVRAGTLSREDAIGIFSTAVLGAQAQGFKPTGNVMSAVHKSMMDFLGKAEEIYFARRKEAGWATQPGGYQQSGGRVFPTKKNSGLDGYALRQEQEKFFERGLSQGALPEVLRGQAHEAGVPRHGLDQLDDLEIEKALQRAIEKSKR